MSFAKAYLHTTSTAKYDPRIFRHEEQKIPKERFQKLQTGRIQYNRSGSTNSINSIEKWDVVERRFIKLKTLKLKDAQAVSHKQPPNASKRTTKQKRSSYQLDNNLKKDFTKDTPQKFPLRHHIQKSNNRSEKTNAAHNIRTSKPTKKKTLQRSSIPKPTFQTKIHSDRKMPSSKAPLRKSPQFLPSSIPKPSQTSKIYPERKIPKKKPPFQVVRNFLKKMSNREDKTLRKSEDETISVATQDTVIDILKRISIGNINVDQLYKKAHQVLARKMSNKICLQICTRRIQSNVRELVGALDKEVGEIKHSHTGVQTNCRNLNNLDLQKKTLQRTGTVILVT